MNDREENSVWKSFLCATSISSCELELVLESRRMPVRILTSTLTGCVRPGQVLSKGAAYQPPAAAVRIPLECAPSSGPGTGHLQAQRVPEGSMSPLEIFPHIIPWFCLSLILEISKIERLGHCRCWMGHRLARPSSTGAHPEWEEGPRRTNGSPVTPQEAGP